MIKTLLKKPMRVVKKILLNTRTNYYLKKILRECLVGEKR